LNFIDVLELFEADPQTEGIVMVGEIAAATRRPRRPIFTKKVSKPVVCVHRGWRRLRASEWAMRRHRGRGQGHARRNSRRWRRRDHDGAFAAEDGLGDCEAAEGLG